MTSAPPSGSPGQHQQSHCQSQNADRQQHQDLVARLIELSGNGRNRGVVILSRQILGDIPGDDDMAQAAVSHFAGGGCLQLCLSHGIGV